MLKALRSHCPRYFGYNFITIHRTLGVTPALAAGVAERLSEVADLVASWKAKTKRIERPAYMSVVTKLWIFLFVGGVIWIIGALELRDSEMVLPFIVRNGGRHGHWTIPISLPTVSLADNLDAQGATNDMDTQQELPPMRCELPRTGWQKIKASE